MEQKTIYNHLISIKNEYTFAIETQMTLQEILREETLHTKHGQITTSDITSILTLSAKNGE